MLVHLAPSKRPAIEEYRLEGENWARPIWQANVDRELSAQTLKLEESERNVFKLQSQLQQMKTQANPLREMQLKRGRLGHLAQKARNKSAPNGDESVRRSRNEDGEDLLQSFVNQQRECFVVPGSNFLIVPIRPPRAQRRLESISALSQAC